MAEEIPKIVVEWEDNEGKPYTSAFADPEKEGEPYVSPFTDPESTAKYEKFMGGFCEELLAEEMPGINKLLENNAGFFDYVFSQHVSTTEEALALLLPINQSVPTQILD